ncbi:hypothetical protein B9Z55_003461 [Caenorhabditis nigoni]|uniref:3-beta hydroxysteroid dehydrogenase/isomerase domain-containing protein n=1 Tax=Caenorhabditis nigoni TaxID=1611254 RepID=A0A2G5VQD7_9PELO|nr:hypothetical protein B9Z55_003461 [Caenorhabditis nigoni]
MKLKKSEEIQVLEKPDLPPLKSGTWRVLITGGAGHLAYHLVEKLVEMTRGEIRLEMEKELKMSENLAKNLSENEFSQTINEEIDKRIPDRIQLILLDLVEPPRDMLKHYCAFVKRDRSTCMEVNSTGTMHLINTCKSKNVKRFIYTSSVGVIFTGNPLIDAKESDIPYPQDWYNYYCESKCHGERIVREASNGTFKTTVLRFNGIYGVGEKRVTERALDFIKSGWWIAMAKTGGVEAMTQLSSVDNCVQGLIKAELALRHSDSEHGQAYHIMDREQCGTFSFWAPLNRALGFPDNMIVFPGFLFRKAAFWAEIIADYFKFDPFISVLEADLLLITTTFSIARAQRELDYDPYPSAMPEIIDFYAGSRIDSKEKSQRKWNFWKKISLSIAIFLIVLPILYFLIYPFLLIFLYLNIWILSVFLGVNL